MNFEEQFPGLKEFVYVDIRSQSVFAHKDLQEILLDRCLDKQRVKAAIEKHTDVGHHFSDEPCECTSCNLIRELKL